MLGGLLAAALIFGSFFGFGVLGITLGQWLDKKYGTRSLDACLFWIIGTGGALLVVWALRVFGPS